MTNFNFEAPTEKNISSKKKFIQNNRKINKPQQKLEKMNQGSHKRIFAFIKIEKVIMNADSRFKIFIFRGLNKLQTKIM